MRIDTRVLACLCALCLCCVAAPAIAQPYAQLNADITWSPGNFNTVDDIAAAFGNARTGENTQLGTAISTTLTMPAQQVWDSTSPSQKALYLINAERVARGLLPLEGASKNVVAKAQAYATLLLTTDQWGHDKDGSPTDRLNRDTAIAGCSEQEYIYGPECLASFVQSDGTVPMPVERAVYGWIYEDLGSSWGHRNTCFAFLNNDFGSALTEGFIGIGLATGGPYTLGQSWPVAAIIVFDFVDPCPTSLLTGDQQLTAVREIPGSKPTEFSLSQNYPNPFNPTTVIQFAVPHRSLVTLTVFNGLGQQVARLVSGEFDAGYHEARFDGSRLASGVYFYRLEAGDFVQTKSMLVLK